MEYGNVIMYVEERVSIGRILLMRPRKCQGAKPYEAHEALWRETVTLTVREDNSNNLQSKEILDVIDDKYINNEILDLYSLLIEIRDIGPKKHPKDKTVRLVYPSVKEFLLSRISINSSLSG